MALSTRQKTLAIVLGLGMCFLVIERLFLSDSDSNPRQAGAAVATHAPAGSLLMPAIRSLADTDSTLLDDSLATRLDSLASSHGVNPLAANDAFCPSSQWLADLRPDGPASSDEVRAQKFAENHQLQAVVLVSEGGSVIVNGKPVTVGQTLDGFRLLSVGNHSAAFVCNKAKVTLRMDAGYESN